MFQAAETFYLDGRRVALIGTLGRRYITCDASALDVSAAFPAKLRAGLKLNPSQIQTIGPRVPCIIS